jgi:hypothetical protein
MKKLGMFMMFVISMIMAMPTINAQELSKRDIKRIEKEARKDAKRLTKEGWKVAPGVPSLERQLILSYTKQAEVDTQGVEKNIKGEAMSVGEFYDSAYTQATVLAKNDIAGKMETFVMGKLQTEVGNGQLSEQQAASMSEIVSNTKYTVAQHLGQVSMPVTIYRDLDNGNVQVRVMAFYSKAAALEVAKAELKKTLRQKAKELDLGEKVVDDILDF